jgi:hypothetical protein
MEEQENMTHFKSIREIIEYIFTYQTKKYSVEDKYINMIPTKELLELLEATEDNGLDIFEK